MRDDLMVKIRSWWLPVAAFLASLSVYVATLPQTTSFEDSAEFVTAAATLSVPHASGYPLYVLLAWPFTKLPFGTVPWRVALFSAVTAAATVALLAILGRRAARRVLGHCTALTELSILAVSLLFAFSGIWWSQAIYAKVYALHVFLTLLSVYCGWRWTEEPQQGGWAFRCGAVLGLSLANHLFLTVAQLPLLVLALAVGLPGRRLALRGWLKIFSTAALGLLFYGLILLRVDSAPYVTIPPTSWPELVRYALRMNYGDLGGAGWNRSGLLLSMLGQWIAALGPLGVALAIGGMVVAWREGGKNQRFFAVIVTGALLTDVLLVSARSNYWNAMLEYVYRVFGLVAIALGFLAAALSAAWLARRAAAKGGRLSLAMPTALLALVIASAVGNSSAVIPFRDGFSYRYARAMLETAPTGAVLILNEGNFTNDTLLFTMSYLQAVEGWRTDVTVVQDASERPAHRPRLPDGYPRFGLAWRRKMMLRTVLEDESLKGRPVFATFNPAIYEGPLAVTDGLVFSVRCPQGCGWKPGAVAVPTLPEKSVYAGQPALSAVISHLLYVEAAGKAAAGDSRGSAALSGEAIDLDSTPMSEDYQALVAYRQKLAGQVEKPEAR